jgi:hypothetical protein
VIKDGDFMSYFLKKTNSKKCTYLQIYESYCVPERKVSAHHSYKSIGHIHELIENGITDPISYYRAEIDKLNQAQKANKLVAKAQQISAESLKKLLGCFLIKSSV